MNSDPHAIAASYRGFGTTTEFAAEIGIREQSIRKRYSQTGSYYQVYPVKLPNRRLLWPPDRLARLLDR